MKGFCESCGRYPSFAERLRGEGLRSTAEGAYLCGPCRRSPSVAPALMADSPTVATRWTSARSIGGRGATLTVLSGLTVIALLGSSMLPSLLGPPGSGGVQGVTRSGPGNSAPEADPRSASPSGRTASFPIPSPVVSATPAATTSTATVTPRPSSSNGGGQGEPAVTVGAPAVRAWDGQFGETRMQVIQPVRNDDERWIRLPLSISSYRIVTPNDQEIASGIFTAALPSAIAPGETGYLVDTVSVAFVEPTAADAVETDVRAEATDPLDGALTVSDLRAAVGVGGGLRVTGQVENEGTTATRWVMAGALVLAPDGRPLGAVYDPTDVGRLGPGQTRGFDTEYPGAPPIPEGLTTKLVGVAFEADP